MKRSIWLIIVWLLMSNTGVFAQCAMCRATVESTMSNGRNLAATGLNTGIIYLFVIPYLIIVIVGYLWYRNSQKDMQQRLALRRRVQQAMSA